MQSRHVVTLFIAEKTVRRVQDRIPVGIRQRPAVIN